MTYQEQLKTIEWQKKKTEILLRDNFTCQLKGCKDNFLNVHHLYYEPNKMLWEYDNETLITLCENCHNIVHKDLAKISGLISYQVIFKGMSFIEVCEILKLM